MTGALAGRTALVTGASRGIGQATARALAAEGARVVVTARSADALAALARELGRGALALPCDLADGDALVRLAREVDAALGGAPDLLVNNAGAFAAAPLAETDVPSFRRMLETNVVGPYALAWHFVPRMRARGSGHLVTIGSIADRHAFPGNTAYAPSKFAARALHEVLRLELRGSGVRATLVSPGPVDTPLWDPIDPDAREGFTPRAQMLRPEQVAEAVRWAVSQPAVVNVDELRLSRS
jgi:NADP-dependent 3-hydroxy acid dehydrogenase YdfG